MHFVNGDSVWTPDSVHHFSKSVVESTDKAKGDVTVSAPNSQGRTSFKDAELLKRDRSEKAAVKTFMDELDPLNIAEVLENVSRLFAIPQIAEPGHGKTRIYSCVGPLLIALNPFQALPIYGEAWIQAYHKAPDINLAAQKYGPHVFATAEERYRQLAFHPAQSIVVCGESGAGKTVTCRRLIEYLSVVAKGPRRAAGGLDPEKLTKSNELLEAFGNATTTRNENSSRFGKFTSLYFKRGADDRFIVNGSGQTHYLLERSRITGAPSMERNYHIFYMMLRSGQADKYKLQPNPETYKYTSQGSDMKQPGVYEHDDKSDFEGLLLRMSSAGFNDAQQQRILSACAAVLLLGNAEITGTEEQAQLKEEVIADACELLGIKASNMCEALVTKTLKLPGETVPVISPVGKTVAMAARDTVAKMVYSRIFDLLVSILDKMLRGNEAETVARIGILDIFGFEDMQVNGFEQMFINLTNERIQHLFNTLMFDKEKQIYAAEGINAAGVLEGPRNIECVELFLGKSPAGIIALLSDQCRTGQPDEKVDGEVFVRKLNASFGSNRFYEVYDTKKLLQVLDRKGLRSSNGKVDMDFKEVFGIKHYAGDIMYTVRGFVPKSRDSIRPELASILKASTKPDVAALFAQDLDNSKAANQTVGEKFRTQLASLVEALEGGDTRFVRCIKSNYQKVPNFVDRSLVAEQLIRGGVIAALEVRSQGLPDRAKFAAFIDEFSVLYSGPRTNDVKAMCQHLLQEFFPSHSAGQVEFMLGKNFIFFKSRVLPWLRGVRAFKYTVYAHRIQKKLWFSRIVKIDRAWRFVQDVQRLAEERGVSNLNAVRQALASASKDISPMYETFIAAKNSSGNDFEKIFEALSGFVNEIKLVYGQTQEVLAVVEKYSQRKEEVEAARALVASAALQGLQALLERLRAVDVNARSSSGVPLEAMTRYRQLAENARLAIEVEGPKKVSLVNANVFEEVDLEAEPWICPDLAHTLAPDFRKWEEQVEAVEELGGELFSNGIHELIRRFSDQLDEAYAELHRMNSIVRECIFEGITGVSDVYANALELANMVEEAESQKNAENFVNYTNAFLLSIQESMLAVEAAKVELQRCKEMKAERRKRLEEIANLQAALVAARQTLERRGVSCRALNVDDNELLIELAKSSAVDVKGAKNFEEWIVSVDSLNERVTAAIAAMEQAAEEETKRAKEAFEERRRRFGGSCKEANDKPAPKPCGKTRSQDKAKKDNWWQKSKHEDEHVGTTNVGEAAAQKAAAEKAAAEKAAADKAAAEKAAEKAAAEKSTAEKVTVETAAAERAIVEKAVAEKVAAEKAAAEQAAAEKAAAEKASADEALPRRASNADPTPGRNIRDELPRIVHTFVDIQSSSIISLD